MDYLGILLAVLILFLAQRLEVRLGPAVGGWVAALPIVFGIAATTIALTKSPLSAATMSWSGAGQLAPMVIYALVIAFLAQRLVPLLAFIFGLISYVLSCLLVLLVQEPIRLLFGACVLGFGLYVFPRINKGAIVSEQQTKAKQGLTLASAAIYVAVIGLTNNVLGPELAGVVGAFPAMTTTLAVAAAIRQGSQAPGSVMEGMVRSLPIYFVYALLFGFLVVTVNVWIATATSLFVSLIVALATWKWLPKRALERNDNTL